MANKSIYSGYPANIIIDQQINEAETNLNALNQWIDTNISHPDFQAKWRQRSALVIKIKQLKQKLNKAHGPESYSIPVRVINQCGIDQTF